MRLRWAGHVASIVEMRNAYVIFIVISEVKRPLGRRKRRWEDNIKMYHKERGWKVVGWIYLA